MDKIINYIASFFTNEFVNNLIPLRKNSVEETLSKYREDIGNYMDSISLLEDYDAPAYKEVYNKFLLYCKKYDHSFSEKELLDFSDKLCVKSLLESMGKNEKYILFKKFLISSLKPFQVIVISKSYEICCLIQKGIILESTKKDFLVLQNNIRAQYINVLNKEKQNYLTKSNIIEQGLSLEDFNNLEAENKTLSEYREIMEELRFENQKLKEEIERLKKENLENLMKSDKEEKYEEDSISSDE